MMNYIFAGMVLFSFVFAALTGRMDKLSEAAMTQACLLYTSDPKAPCGLK